MYDYMVGDCPHCGSFYHSQTKIGNCKGVSFYVKEPILGIKEGLQNTTLGLKEDCSSCGRPVTATIKGGVFTSLRTNLPIHVEVQGGETSLLKDRKAVNEDSESAVA